MPVKTHLAMVAIAGGGILVLCQVSPKREIV